MAALTATTTMCTKQQAHQNPFLAEYTTQYKIPPFDEIHYDDYLEAMEAGFAEHNANIHAIIVNPEEPTFENTIHALDMASPILDRVGYVFDALTETDACPEFDAISEVYSPAYSRHSDEVMMNDSLFARVKAVYENSANLDRDQQRLTEKYYKRFVQNGAMLTPEQKEELKAVNSQLADLFLKYNKNLLNATNSFSVTTTNSDRLSGLPASSIAQAQETAAANGVEGYMFTLKAPSRLPVLQYADDRELRREIYQGYTSLASEGEYNNYPVINEILQARAKKAALLGYDTFGSLMTDKVMAKTVENAENLLMQIWKPAVKRIGEEVKEMQAVVDAEGGNFKIEPWDYYYYAEKVRKQKYDLDEAKVREYFAVDSVKKGLFLLAETLYGVRFTPLPDAPKYHPEVDVYDVTDIATGEHVAVFMTDYFPRASKRQGAWMSEFNGSSQLADGSWERPIIYNVGNFTKPTATTPALLTLDEVETMFHEFGHGLHGMLTKVRYKGIAGTNVDRDFVELPSQINEHWAMTPELLKQYAHHYKTGEVIPDELIAKLDAASTHNMGFTTGELVGAALLDLEFGKLNPEGDIDVAAFEQKVSEKIGMPKELTYRYRAPYFKHIFGSDGYASGYYTYLWAEVLDTDAFELFKEKGVFDAATAKSFKENVLEAGDSEDPMTLFVRFRGAEPSVDALLRNRGLN